MRRRDSWVGCALVLACLVTSSGCSTESGDATRLADIRQKDGGGATPPFFPMRPWSVQYAWNCKQQIASGRGVRAGLQLDVKNADDNSYVETQPRMKLNGVSGKGTLHYTRPGAYVVTATSECDVTLHVRQAPKEAT